MLKNYNQKSKYLVSGATFNEIAQGVGWVKENCERLSGNGAKGKYFHAGEIRIKFTDAGTLPMFSGVALTGLSTIPVENKFMPGTPTFTAAKVTTANADLPFAICAEPANYGELTKAVLIGVIPAPVVINNSTHQYAKPTPGSVTGALESCESGTARIVWKAGASGTQWCMIQIGAGGGGSTGGNAGYDGMFAVIAASDQAGNQILKVVWPQQMKNNAIFSYCGCSDIITNVPVMSIPRQAGDLYLIAEYVNYAYSVSLSFTMPAAGEKKGYVHLARITSDSIQQIWTCGEIYFGSRYFI